VGAALVTAVTGGPDFLSTISAHQTTLVIGAFLMLLNTVVDVGKGVLFFPILENHGKRSALAYLAFIVVQVVMLDVGVLALRFRTRLIPRFLAVGGLVGYVSLMVGMIAELFGIHIGLMLSIPGVFFEVGLPVWLFIKGFQPEAYSGRAAKVMTPTVRPALATP
jgi:hypothetical protein